MKSISTDNNTIPKNINTKYNIILNTFLCTNTIKMTTTVSNATTPTRNNNNSIYRIIKKLYSKNFTKIPYTNYVYSIINEEKSFFHNYFHI